MYSEKLENLITLALADGVLTDKEKQVLFKKAEAEGIDLDEFEMVLDAKLHEVTKRKPEPPEAKPQSNKLGDMKKCPACGAIIKAFTTKCPDCGHEFRNIEANTSITRLSKMLDDVESQRDDKVSAAGVIGASLRGSIGGGALANALGGESKTDKRKKEIIASFPIPNTKEDILEFLSLALPKTKTQGGYGANNNSEHIDHNIFVPVWQTKCEQIIMKSKFLFKDDKQTLAEIESYAKQNQKEVNTKKIKNIIVSIIPIIIIIAFYSWMPYFFSNLSKNHDEGIEKEKARLEMLLEKVSNAVKEERFDEAEILALQLRWEYSDSYSHSDIEKLSNSWSEKRESITNTINELKSKKRK